MRLLYDTERDALGYVHIYDLDDKSGPRNYPYGSLCHSMAVSRIEDEGTAEPPAEGRTCHECAAAMAVLTAPNWVV